MLTKFIIFCIGFSWSETTAAECYCWTDFWIHVSTSIPTPGSLFWRQCPTDKEGCVCVDVCVCVCNEWVHGSSVYTVVGHTSYGGPAWKRRIAKSLLSAQGVCEESEGIIVKFGRTAKTIYPTVIGTKTITYQCVFRSFTFVDEIRIEHLQIWQTLE